MKIQESQWSLLGEYCQKKYNLAMMFDMQILKGMIFLKKQKL